MSKRLIVEHPPWVLLPRKTVKDKKVSINLNIYRNQHPMEENQCKKVVKENVEKYLKETGQEGIKFTSPVNTTFKLYKPTKRRMDKSNVFSIGTKYIYDALVELGVLEDDNDDYIKIETLFPTEHDKENPRIVIVLEEIEES